jgi:methyl-accepting chemotaxis protein
MAIGSRSKKQLVAATKAAEAMTRGDFTGNFESTAKGEVSRLMQSLKSLQGRLQQLVASQVEQRGSNDRPILNDFPGAYGEMVNGINYAIANQVAQQSRIVETVTRYAKGDFSADLGLLPGDTVQTTGAVAAIKANLQSISKVNCLAKRATRLWWTGDARK